MMRFGSSFTGARPKAALGDSNDGEIEALQEALDLALSALGIKLPPEYEPYDEE